jgi:hypothetical protein
VHLSAASERWTAPLSAFSLISARREYAERQGGSNKHPQRRSATAASEKPTRTEWGSV